MARSVTLLACAVETVCVVLGSSDLVLKYTGVCAHQVIKSRHGMGQKVCFENTTP